MTKEEIWKERKKTLIEIGARLAPIVSSLMNPNISSDCEITCIACFENIDDQRALIESVEQDLRRELSIWNPKMEAIREVVEHDLRFAACVEDDAAMACR